MAPIGIAPEVQVVGVEPTEAEIGDGDAPEPPPPTPASCSCTTRTSTHPIARCSTPSSARARALAVVLMRDPYDARFILPIPAVLTAYGWRRCQLDAALARLLS